MEFDFSENTSVAVDNFEKRVPQDFRGLYVEKDGNMVLDSDHVGVKSSVAAVTRLNQALKAARGEAKDLKGKVVDLSPLKDYGDNPSTIVEGVSKAINEAKKAGGAKGSEDLERQVTKIKADLNEAHTAEKTVMGKRIEALVGQLHGLLVTNAATQALVEADAISPDLVMPHIASQVKVQEEDGKFKVFVVDSVGDPRYSGTTGVPMTIKELVDQMKHDQKFEVLFKSDKGSGGGSPHTRRPTGGTGGRTADLTPAQKIQRGLDKGQASRK